MSADLQNAIAHFAKGDIGKTREFLDKALTQDPSLGEGWHLRGVLALHTGQAGEAVAHLNHAAKLRPNDILIQVNLGAALTTTGQFAESERVLKKVLAARPPIPEAYYQMGTCLIGLQKMREAATAFADAVKLRPDWVIALEMMADTLFMSSEYDKAMEAAQRALALDPKRAICHRVVADVLMRRMQYDDAIPHYHTALALAPQDGIIRNNYALTLTRQGRDAEALAEYRKAIALLPTLQTAREGYSTGCLLAGEFAEGWAYYGARHKPGRALVTRKGAPPPDHPSQLRGKRVLGWLDQGIGDQIMFSSLIADLLATGADLTVECDARLIPLLKRVYPALVARAGRETEVPADSGDFDYQLYIPETAGWFRAEFSAFPHHHGYLKADNDLTKKLRQSYLKEGGDRPLIGISWRTADNTKLSGLKTLGLHQWGPILQNRDATFVKLQYGELKEEIAFATQQLGVKIICDPAVDPIADMDTFASQVAAMDLVITTSNATSHMAGSLNVPTWVLVPKGYGAMWHWFLEREDSPWYPSVRVVRQKEQGAWPAVLDQVSRMLSDFRVTGRK